MFSCCGKQCFRIILKLLLTVCCNNHRDNSEHHSLVTGCKVIEELFHFFLLLVKGELPPVVRNFQHIIYAGIHIAAPYLFGSFAERGDHFLLHLRRLHGDIVILHFRYGKIEHIRRFDVRHLFEHRHQFGQVIEFRKACFRSVSCSFWCKLDCRDRLAEHRRPSVKVLQIVFLQRPVLQIPLYGIQFIR